MSPAWRLRLATRDDAELLAHIVVEATKHQGRWPETSPAEEAEWRAGFAEWSRESVDAEHDNPGARRLYERLGCVEAGSDDPEVLLRWTPPD